MATKTFRTTAALAAFLSLAACGWLGAGSDENKTEADLTPAERKERIRDACATGTTYARLKDQLFAEAAKVRKDSTRNLETLAANSVIRMEEPLLKSRDETLNVTVCTGRLILELPPGAENAFDGERRLVAEIEYAAQAAADGSGLVYQMTGAEPIIYRLATFDMGRTRLAPAAPPAGDGIVNQAGDPFPPAPVGPPPPQPPQPRPAPEPVTRPQPAPVEDPLPPRSAARPSFNCASARTRSERMVCSSEALAARDRSMASVYNRAMEDADPETRTILRRTRDRFLAYRERCGSEACIADAYQGRTEEIRDIMADSR
ncbi:lysozyme inhibitor LprI family protein [Sphingosinicella sp. LY1275]|uniref:lysozyme inhibitor LprI family protein n=1 Tax=Sphingosinicella sp. LY1275 TaxID=3095379 RepID=UPI002ADEE681|nr:lysozyme inhibitor LprI family protein [Sphingosinicella sp. LY1275]MEA1013300.1 hypothetical protein [Sphingosinicella sp. LY1275]